MGHYEYKFVILTLRYNNECQKQGYFSGQNKYIVQDKSFYSRSDI